ncbi:MAG: TPM domain-containing protein [Bacteroidota bacterium]
MQPKFVKYISLFIVFVLCFLNPVIAQDYLPEKPKIQTSVYDFANMMSGFEAKSLEQKLIKYSDSTSTQIVVITVNSLEGNDIAMYATELAHKWGIGQAGKDNGILIVVSKNDRKVTIRTGYGVEHLLTDALSRRIIENIITPHFKQGNFYGGLDNGTSVIIEIMSGEYEGEPSYNGEEEGIPFFFIIFLFIILMIILSRRSRGGKGGDNNRGRRGGMSILDAIILSNAGRGTYHGSGGFGGGGASGGLFGGGGGGGFGGGFGGGGFGGGGASGGW